MFGTIASQFADAETDRLFNALMDKLSAVHDTPLNRLPEPKGASSKPLSSPSRAHVTSRASADTCDAYDRWVDEQCERARTAGHIEAALEHLKDATEAHAELATCLNTAQQAMDENCKKALSDWDALRSRYAEDLYRFEVRGRTLEQPSRARRSPGPSPASPSRGSQTQGTDCSGSFRRTSRAVFRTQRASSRSSDRAKIPRACSPEKAAPSEPAASSITSLGASTPSACPRPSTR